MIAGYLFDYLVSCMICFFRVTLRKVEGANRTRASRQLPAVWWDSGTIAVLSAEVNLNVIT